MEEYREFEVKGPYRIDTSIGVRPSENGVVDTVVMTQSHDGGRMYKMRVRDLRIPEIGFFTLIFTFTCAGVTADQAS